MFAIIGALIAGALTTLAPCVLPMLPVIVGSSLTEPSITPKKSFNKIPLLNSPGTTRALIITGSLGVSIVLFTLLLKLSTDALGIPAQAWPIVSGTLLIVLGALNVFPGIWEWFAGILNLQATSNNRLAAARRRSGTVGAVATGAALGPVFSSCSPMYGYVVVTVLPAQFGFGLILLTTYALGLCDTLLAVTFVGRSLISKLGWAADAHGWFRRGLGVLFVVIGVTIMFGLDKDIQAWLITHSPIAPWELDAGFVPE